MKTRLLLAAALLWAAPAAAEPRLSVSFDPALELLGVVQVLAAQSPAPDGFVAPPEAEAAALRAQFSALLGHKAVTLTRQLDPAAFDYYKRGDSFTRLSPPPELARRYLIPDLFVNSAGGPAAFDRWLDALRQFAATPEFRKHVEARRAQLAPAVAEFSAAVSSRNYIARIEKYTGLPYSGHYDLLLAPTFKPGSMVNAVIRRDDGTNVVRTIMGAERLESGRLRFPLDRLDPTMWHELAHGVVDVLGDLVQEDIAARSAVYGTFPWQCYNEWHQCVKENVVRAVMLRMLALEHGEETGERQRLEEGADKWPYLPEMTRRLRAFEASRAPSASLAEVYWRLVDVFPPGKAPAEAPAQVELKPGDPGPEWLLQAASPFRTQGQRESALWYLDKMTPTHDVPSVRLRRGALEALVGRYEAARLDAEAVLAKEPASVGAQLVKAAALRGLGQDHNARAALQAAHAGCAAGARAGAPVACANVERMLSSTATALPREPTVKRASSRASRSPLYSFAVDPRVELLSVILALGRTSETLGAGGEAYAKRIHKRFAPWARHPAVGLLSELLAKGTQEHVVSQMLLRVGPPPELQPSRDKVATEEGTQPEAAGASEEWLEAARDFAKKSKFAAFFEDEKRYYETLVAEAHSETRDGLSPDAVESYLRTDFDGKLRFILAPLLPEGFNANLSLKGPGGVEEIRMRSEASQSERSVHFSFETFGAGVAHELAHVLLDPTVLAAGAELQAYSSLRPERDPRCADSWEGCVLELVDLAVTLRALKASNGEQDYRLMLDYYVSRGFAELPALCARLAEYEADPVRYRTFEDFFPRLAAVFAGELEDRVRAQAAAAIRSSLPAGPPASISMEPRLELLGAVLALSSAVPAAAAPEYAARTRELFAPVSSHPAVAATAAAARAPGGPKRLAALILSASPLPRLQPPQGASAQDAALLAGLADFAKAGGFPRVWNETAELRAELLKRASDENARAMAPVALRQYVGEDLPEAPRFLLAPLLSQEFGGLVRRTGARDQLVVRPASSRSGRTVFGFDAARGSVAGVQAADFVQRILPADEGLTRSGLPREALVAALLARAHGLNPGGFGDEAVMAELLRGFERGRPRGTLRAYYPRLSEEYARRRAGAGGGFVEFRVDPSVELYGVLRMLSRPEAATDRPYERAAAARFRPFADDPAVKAVAELRRRNQELPLQLLLLVSTPPALAAGTVPDGYLDQVGGKEGLEAWLGSLRAFARKSRFSEFLEQEAAELNRLEALGRAEGASGPGLEAVAAYLGEPMRARYEFLLAPLLESEEATNMTILEAGRTREIRIRPALHHGGEERFQLDDFGNSVAHELVHTVTNSFVPDRLNLPGTPPPGCNDNTGRSWSVCVQEHLAFAVTLRLVALAQGEVLYETTLRRFERRGFPFLRGLGQKLKDYERQRQRYPALRSFYAKLEPAFGATGPWKDPLAGKEARRLRSEGVTHFVAGRSKEAVAAFEKARALAPGDPETLLDLGVVRDQMGEAEEALRLYEESASAGTAIGPSVWEITAAALSSRAELLAKRGSRAQAVDDLRAALRLAPKDWKSREALEKRLRAIQEVRP